MLRFQFGQNWQNFSARHMSHERVQVAANALQKLVDLQEKTFLDAGAGLVFTALLLHNSVQHKYMGLISTRYLFRPVRLMLSNSIWPRHSRLKLDHS